MPARIIRPPCTRYQSECRLTFSRIASRMAWAAASSDMVIVCLHQTLARTRPQAVECGLLKILYHPMAPYSRHPAGPRGPKRAPIEIAGPTSFDHLVGAGE